MGPNLIEPISRSDYGLLLYTLPDPTHQTGNRGGLPAQTDHKEVPREAAADQELRNGRHGPAEG